MLKFAPVALSLKPYQHDGMAWMADRPRTLLADEAGLGKTVQLLGVAKEPVLVVAPAMVLDAGTWDDEIEKWVPGMDVTQVAYSSLAQRAAKGRVPRDANGFPRTPPKEQYRHKWGTVVLDESHYIKGRKTSWANAALMLEAEEFRLATGTPLVNWADEAFMQLRALRPGEARAGHELGSYWRWVKRWFHVSDGRFGKEIGDLRTAEHIDSCKHCRDLQLIPVTWEEFHAGNWGDQYLRRLRADVLADLPPLTRQIWRTPMSKEQSKFYNELKRDFLAWINDIEVAVWSEPGMLVKLAQVATGLETQDPSITNPTGKFKVLRQILEDRPQQTFVVGHFQSTIEASAATARRMGLKVGVVHGSVSKTDRQTAIRAFQQGDIDVLAASLGTISEGVTLHQGGCDLMVRLERSWTPTKNDQVDRRLHRLGVEKPIHLIDLVTPNTLDERVMKVLGEKSDQQMKALPNSEVARLV